MKEETFYLVREDVLPDAMRKTLEVKKLLDRKKADSVADAVQKADLSRSAFYKYRDAVFPFYTMVKEQIFKLWLTLAVMCYPFTKRFRCKEERMSPYQLVQLVWKMISTPS